jgi:hypothetical protein
MPTPNYAAYKAADPYFNLVRRALGDLVEGDHFFDIIAEDTIYEVLYDLGWPRVIRGTLTSGCCWIDLAQSFQYSLFRRTHL